MPARSAARAGTGGRLLANVAATLAAAPAAPSRTRTNQHVHCHQGPLAADHGDGIVAATDLVHPGDVGSPARHRDDGHHLSRAVPRRDLHRDLRSGARRTRHPHERRLLPRPGLRRALLAPLSPAALARGRGRRAAAEDDAVAASRLPPGHPAAGDLHLVALADRDRQDRAQPEEPARVRQDLAHRTGPGAQAGQVRHGLGAGDGLLPRLAQREGLSPLGREEADHLGHVDGDQPGAQGGRGFRLHRDPGRRADDPHDCVLLPGADGHDRLPRRGVQPRGVGARGLRGLGPHLLGQPHDAAGHGQVGVRELDRDVPRAR